MEPVLEFLLKYREPFFYLLGLVLADFGLGVIVALKTGQFNLQRIAEFYRTSVAPNVLVWVLVNVLVGLVLPPDAGRGYLDETIAYASYGLAVAQVGGSVVKSLTDLGLNVPVLSKLVGPKSTT